MHPLGFDISEKAVRHAGLDYWKDVEIIEYKNTSEFLSLHKNDILFFLSTKGRKVYSDVEYKDIEDIYLVFGKESRGIEEEILVMHPDTTLRIPMLNDTRSLNLSNSVAIALYEVIRQKNFDLFNKAGELHRLKWEK